MNVAGKERRRRDVRPRAMTGRALVTGATGGSLHHTVVYEPVS
jgi:hypothetical protein